MGLDFERMRRVLVLLFICNASMAAGSKTTCTKRELKALDCRLYTGAYNLRLLEKTVAWDDGTWHTVDPIPLVGEGVEWEKIQFEMLAQHPILQMWIWDKGVGESGVQSLHWYVADAEKRKLTVLAEGVVRKRHLKAVIDAAPAAVATAKGKPPSPPPAPPPHYLYDAMEPHSLKTGKGGQLQWTLGGVSHGI